MSTNCRNWKRDSGSWRVM